MKSIVAEWIAVEVLIGADFLNHNVLAILSPEQRIGFKKGKFLL